jgi:hypothetical protein
MASKSSSCDGVSPFVSLFTMGNLSLVYVREMEGRRLVAFVRASRNAPIILDLLATTTPLIFISEEWLLHILVE